MLSLALMKHDTSIAILDRSELGRNMYGLLLKPLHHQLIIQKGLNELAAIIKSRSPSLLILNTNVIRSKTSDICMMLSAKPYDEIPKIFIHKNTIPADDIAMFSQLFATTMIERPFHPDELYEAVANSLPKRNR